MPHLTIDYSANMEERTNIADLCDCIRKSAIETGIFPLAGIRVRAFRADHVSIADGGEEHGFIDISIRLREGRAAEAKKEATTQIFEAAKSFLAPVLEKYPFALSMEMRDIDAELSPKLNTIREYLNEG